MYVRCHSAEWTNEIMLAAVSDVVGSVLIRVTRLQFWGFSKPEKHNVGKIYEAIELIHNLSMWRETTTQNNGVLKIS